MANFDFKGLILINPCKLDDECYNRAMHAHEILDNAEIFDNFKDSIKKMDYLVASSSIESQNDKRHLRNASDLEDLSNKLMDIKGNIGLVFGREDYGLFNEEISLCDTLLRIQTSDSYLSMNLSHAVSIVLYRLYIDKFQEKKEKKVIGKIEKEKLFDFFSQILDEINYPNHKKEKTDIMFKRLMGRAIPSKWEYHTMMGVFSRALKKMKEKK